MAILVNLRGDEIGSIKILTARKILPLLDLLAKFIRVLACSCSPNFCVARKLAKQIFYFCSCSQKNSSARHARECSQRPFVTLIYTRKSFIKLTPGDLPFTNSKVLGSLAWLPGLGCKKHLKIKGTRNCNFKTIGYCSRKKLKSPLILRRFNATYPGVYVGDLLDPELLVQAKTK